MHWYVVCKSNLTSIYEHLFVGSPLVLFTTNDKDKQIARWATAVNGHIFCYRRSSLNTDFSVPKYIYIYYECRETKKYLNSIALWQKKCVDFTDWTLPLYLWTNRGGNKKVFSLRIPFFRIFQLSIYLCKHKVIFLLNAT